MEHRRLIGADTCREEHVTELRTGRICDDALDVVLRHADGCGVESGDGADHRDHAGRHERVFVQRREEADEVDARGHHGCGVDQGGNRRRAFHGVRQPDVQEELGRLAHRADEQQHADHFDRPDTVAEEVHDDFARWRRICKGNRGHHGVLAQRFHEGRELNRAVDAEHSHDAKREAKVADTVGDEGLD